MLPHALFLSSLAPFTLFYPSAVVGTVCRGVLPSTAVQYALHPCIQPQMNQMWHKWSGKRAFCLFLVFLLYW